MGLATKLSACDIELIRGEEVAWFAYSSPPSNRVCFGTLAATSGAQNPRISDLASRMCGLPADVLAAPAMRKNCLTRRVQTYYGLAHHKGINVIAVLRQTSRAVVLRLRRGING